MKRSLLAVFVTALFTMPIAVILDAQDTTTIPEPEQIGIPYLINSGKLIPLERQRMNVGIHMKALGFAGGTSVVRFNGKASPVHVASQNVRFAIRFTTMPPTPSSLINLDVLVAKKDSALAPSADTNS